MPVEYPISRYRKIQKPNAVLQKNQIKIKINAPPFSYTAYASKLLMSGEFNIVSLIATGAAASTLVKVVEHLRNNLHDLHVVYKITKRLFEDKYEPLEVGLDIVHSTRTVSTLEAHMALEPQEGFEGENGYMEPIDSEEIDQKEFESILQKYDEMKVSKKAMAAEKQKLQVQRKLQDEKVEEEKKEKHKKKKRKRKKKKKGKGGFSEPSENSPEEVFSDKQGNKSQTKGSGNKSGGGRGGHKPSLTPPSSQD